MADTPVFQRHHAIEQQAFKESELLQALSKHDLFDLHGPHNTLNLPTDQRLAAKLGMSPHSGGPLDQYSDGLRDALDELADTVDGKAAINGAPAVAQRIATRVNDLADTLKIGLTNGDLLTNTPQGMTPEQTNRYATGIALVNRMPISMPEKSNFHMDTSLIWPQNQILRNDAPA